MEADRCYFCYEAPCIAACPTSIDIPLFIRQITAGSANGAARTILSENILGGMCARVCPTEILCEGACVRNAAEKYPVRIGLLQRYATDHFMRCYPGYGRRAPPTGRCIAVVGGGPAGLAAAHRLATHGHNVTIFEARNKIGGLNEYGIAAYKTVDDFAQVETEFVLSIGGIAVEARRVLGVDLTLDTLRREFDAVFLGIGLAGVNALGLAEEAIRGVVDAIEWIAALRQATDLSTVAVGRRVVVVGGGMTAIDAAVQAKKLGAAEVTIVYRRGREHMSASQYEQTLAETHGVDIRHWLSPRRLTARDGHVSEVVLERTRIGNNGQLVGTGEEVNLATDMVMKAIGQVFVPAPITGGVDVLNLVAGRIAVDGEGRTSVPGVWAGGDCAAEGRDLTVEAVEDGKRAAESIHLTLTAASAVAVD